MTKKRMFVRFWKKAQVDATVHALKVQFDPKITDTDGFIQVFAPDGDVVLAAMPKDANNYIVRLSPEVFNEGTPDEDGQK